MKIALVSMPFYSPSWPSIQLGILKSVLEAAGHCVDDVYLNLSFAKCMGIPEYLQLSNRSDTLIGDWLFAREAFDCDDEEQYLAVNAQTLNSIAAGLGCSLDALRERLIEIRDDLLPDWLDQVADSHPWDEYAMVGFSCTFMQSVASVALARRIRQRVRNTSIVFGGSSMEGPMGRELAERVDWIDCVAQGEGENTILEIVNMIEQDRALPRLQSPSLRTDLDRLPIPSYDGYYDLLEGDSELAAIEDLAITGLPLETSRGCWWGEKHHCKFCGLNGDTIVYRAKSSERTLAEMNALTLKHNRYYYQIVDNILGVRQFKDLLGTIREKGLGFSMFVEVKSNLTFREMKALKEGGAESIQPGIESLHTQVLRLMNKGVTGVQNLNALKWGRFFNLDVAWNFLFGFPGERDEYYKELCDIIPKIVHFQPPSGAVRIRLDRFSPYFNEWLGQKRAQVPESERSFANVRPGLNYDLVYPRAFDKWKISFFYESEARTAVAAETYVRFMGEVEKWKELWNSKADAGRPSLRFLCSLEGGHVVDARSTETETTAIAGHHFQVARVLDLSPLTRSSIQERTQIPEMDLKKILDDFVEAGFVLSMDGRYCWLPVPDRIAEDG